MPAASTVAPRPSIRSSSRSRWCAHWPGRQPHHRFRGPRLRRIERSGPLHLRRCDRTSDRLGPQRPGARSVDERPGRGGHAGRSVHRICRRRRPRRIPPLRRGLLRRDGRRLQRDVPAHHHTWELPGSSVAPRYSPFNAQVLNGKVYVTYAKVDRSTGRDLHAKGAGRVDVFDLDGTLLKRMRAHSELNAPWGLAIAPNRIRQAQRRSAGRQLR